jgi:hypothetical protein
MGQKPDHTRLRSALLLRSMQDVFARADDTYVHGVVRRREGDQ